jgi:general secretion pathway protein G
MIRSARRSKTSRGFTLIELMLVIVIIGVLAAMVIPSFAGRAERARLTAAKTDITARLGTALDLYEQDTGAYPTTSEGLKALIKAPEGITGWHGPYLKGGEDVPLDPWGRPYVYKCPGSQNETSYDLMSYGRDGKEGGTDDIANYNTQQK